MQEEKMGIVRRIDYLGRLVIPKEMRKVLKWNENDPLEIYTVKNEMVIKKYSPMTSVATYAADVAGGIEEQTDKPCVVTDMETIVYASGKYKDLNGKRISDSLEQAIRDCKSLLLSRSEGGKIIPIARGEVSGAENQIIVPILSDGYCYGSVVLFDKEKEHTLNSNDVKLVRLGANLLSKTV